MQNFDLVLPLARDALAHSSFAPDLLRRIAQIKNVLDRAARDGDGAAAVEAQDQAAALGEILERYPPVGSPRSMWCMLRPLTTLLPGVDTRI